MGRKIREFYASLKRKPAAHATYARIIHKVNKGLTSTLTRCVCALDSRVLELRRQQANDAAVNILVTM